MHKMIPAIVLTAGLACGGSKVAPGPQDEPKSGAPEPAADERRADEKPAAQESAAEKTVGDADVACGAIVTVADVEQACAVPTTMEITKAEGRTPLAVCSRKLRGPDSKSVSFKLAEHESVEKASGLKWADGATPIADLGDVAHGYVADKGGQFDWHTVEVRSGNRVMYLRSINETGGTPLCTVEQLTDVAREAMGRLPK